MADIKQINVGGTAYNLKASSLEHKTVDATTLDNSSGTFAFSGSGNPGPSTDGVGLQIGDNADKIQIVGKNDGIGIRQNDSGGTNSANGSNGIFLPHQIHADHVKGTIPSATSYKNFKFLGSDGGNAGLLENVGYDSGQVETRIRTYNCINNTGGYIQLSAVGSPSQNPYVTLGHYDGTNWISPQDYSGAILRNISYGTADPSGGQNGQVYIQYF